MTLPRLLCAAALLLAVPARAQLPPSGDGFLFREPRLTATLRAGYGHATAGSDVFGFATDQLTLERRNFDGFAVGGELAVRLAPRVDVLIGASYAGREATSEFRDWVDQDDLPIEQTTRFERVPLTVGARAYLLPRGRSVGRFAWIPAPIAPYLGGAAGTIWYRFQQQGDFVDFETQDVFADRLESQGWAPAVQALGGVDLSLSPRFALTLDGRFTWAEADLDAAFQQFDPIDLSGFAATLGLSLRI